MKKNKRCVGLLLLGCVMLASSCGREPNTDKDGKPLPAGAKLDLRLRLRKGKTYRFRMTTEQDIVQSPQGKKQTMSQTVGIGMSFAARDVDADGATRVKMTYDWAAFGQDGPMGRIEYDSAKPPPHVHPAAKGFAALVGQSLTMTMASDGSVSHIEGVDALLDHVLKEISVPSEAARATLEKQLRKQFGSKAVSEMVKQMTATYPDKPVAIGGSWSKSMDVTRGFPVALDSTWTLRARRNGVATIDVKSRVRPSTNTDPVQMGPMSLTYSLKGEQTGTVQVDEASGWMLSSKLTQDISGQITATGAPGTSGPTAWPVRLKAVIEISSSR